MTQRLAFSLQNTSNLCLLLMCMCVLLCVCVFIIANLSAVFAQLQSWLTIWKCLKSRRPDAETLWNNQSFLTFKISVIGPASFSVPQLPSKMTFTLLFIYILLLLTLSILFLLTCYCPFISSHFCPISTHFR